MNMGIFSILPFPYIEEMNTTEFKLHQSPGNSFFAMFLLDSFYKFSWMDKVGN